MNSKPNIQLGIYLSTFLEDYTTMWGFSMECSDLFGGSKLLTFIWISLNFAKFDQN